MARRKRTQTTTSERRASIRLAAGKLKNPNTPAAANNGTVTLTAHNMFGLCSGGAPNLFTVKYYRLVL